MKLNEIWKKWKNEDKILDKNAKNKNLNKNIVQKLIILLVSLIVIVLILSINFFPSKIAIKEGQICSKDVLSPGTVEFVDSAATQDLKEKASKSIKEVYDLNLVNIENAEKQVDGIFLKIREYKNTLSETPKDNNFDVSESKAKLKDDKNLEEIAKKINTDLGLNINEQVIINCFKLDDLSLSKINRDIKNSLRMIMEQGIKENDLENAKKQLVREISEISIDHYDA